MGARALDLPKQYYDVMDQISGGRFLFGIGAGWNAEEMADHGTAFATRFKVIEGRHGFAAARRAIAFGDGWVEAGRDPVTLPVTIFGTPDDSEAIARYRDAGVARVVFNLPPAKADEVVPVLDRCAALMR